jgi:hypothetical protein
MFPLAAHGLPRIPLKLTQTSSRSRRERDPGRPGRPPVAQALRVDLNAFVFARTTMIPLDTPGVQKPQ